MKILFPLTIVLACSSPQVSEQQFLVNHQSVKIDTATGSGSGFAISPTEVITAWHVVSVDHVHLVDMEGPTPSSIQRLGDLDVALLTFDTPHGLKIWQLSNRTITPAEPIYISGWGMGVHWWSRGFGTTDPNRLSLDIAPGDSGSPVFDSTGAVVGILVARGIHGNHHAIIVPIGAWFSLLTSHPATSPPSGLRPQGAPLDR